MSDTLPAIPESSTLHRLQKGVPVEQAGALQAAMLERVTDERFDRPVPRFLTELPFGGDDDEITDRIAMNILTADDPDSLQGEAGTVALKDLVGKALTVWDIRVMSGEKPGGWGAYLLLDVTIGDDPTHVVANTGAKQIVTRLAHAWVYGRLPLEGSVVEIAGTGRRGNPALAFLGEPEPF